MNTQRTQRQTAHARFPDVPTDYLGLCQRYLPRPLHDESDYAAARHAIEPLLGYEDRLSADQVDYLEAVSSFIEAFDRETVTWPKTTPRDTLRYLLEQQGLTASDLSRLLGADRTLGAKILRGQRRLTVGHIQILARHFNVDPGLFI